MSVNQGITGPVIIWTQVQLRFFGINKPVVLKTCRTWTNSAKKSGKKSKTVYIYSCCHFRKNFDLLFILKKNSFGSWIKYAGFCCGFCENMSVQQKMQDISRVAIISNFPPLWAAFDFLADYFCTRSTWAVYKKHLMFFMTGSLRTNTTKQE